MCKCMLKRSIQDSRIHKPEAWAQTPEAGACTLAPCPAGHGPAHARQTPHSLFGRASTPRALLKFGLPVFFGLQSLARTRFQPQPAYIEKRPGGALEVLGHVCGARSACPGAAPPWPFSLTRQARYAMLKTSGAGPGRSPAPQGQSGKPPSLYKKIYTAEVQGGQ
jgi:hypothetical protein